MRPIEMSSQVDCVCFAVTPLDVVKTRLQAQLKPLPKCKYPGIL